MLVAKRRWTALWTSKRTSKVPWLDKGRVSFSLSLVMSPIERVPNSDLSLAKIYFNGRWMNSAGEAMAFWAAVSKENMNRDRKRFRTWDSSNQA